MCSLKDEKDQSADLKFQKSDIKSEINSFIILYLSMRDLNFDEFYICLHAGWIYINNGTHVGIIGECES